MKTTEWLGVYGAVLSSANLAWQYLTARRKVRVEAMYGIGGLVGPAVHVACRNYGTRDVVIRAVGILWPYRQVPWTDYAKAIIRCGPNWRRRVWVHGDHEFHFDGQFPTTVPGGDSIGLDFAWEEIRLKLKEEGAAQVIFYVQDALGQNTYSNVFKFRPLATTED